MTTATPTLALKFLLSNPLAGSLIGTGGHAIKDMMEISEAKVQVSSVSDTYPGTSDRVVLVSGTSDAINSAQALIWELIALMTKNAGNTRKVEWDPRKACENINDNDDVEVSGRFTIPAAATGAVLGKAGAAIQEISASSGARVGMTTKDDALFTQERIVTITGTKAQCVLCTSLIIGRMSSQTEIPPFVNKGTTYTAIHAVGRESRSRSSGDRGASASAAPAADTTITVTIPDDLVGNIFGKQGATMREISALSGAKIVVSPRDQFAEGTNNRIVTITGSPAAAQTAHLYITQRLYTPSNPRKPHNK